MWLNTRTTGRLASRFPLAKLGDKTIVGEVGLVEVRQIMVVAHTPSSVRLLPADNLQDVLINLLGFETLHPLCNRDCLRRENTLGLNVAGTHISLLRQGLLM